MRAARKQQPFERDQSLLQPRCSYKRSELTQVSRKGAPRTAQVAAVSGRSSVGTVSTTKPATPEENKHDPLWPVPLHERTPEQTALIALQGLLEAREAHIARLESDLAAAKSAAEQRLASLQESCHAKIEALQAAHAEQLSSQQDADREELRKAKQELHALSERARQNACDGAGAASKLSHAYKREEKLGAELGRLQSKHAAQLQEHSSLKAAHAQSEAERQRWEQQARACMQASGSALQGMDECLRKLSGTVSDQRAEIAALQATVQQQCRERVALQSQLDAVQYERTRVRAG